MPESFFGNGMLPTRLAILAKYAFGERKPLPLPGIAGFRSVE